MPGGNARKSRAGEDERTAPEDRRSETARPFSGAIEELLLQILQDFGRMGFRVRHRNPMFLNCPIGTDQCRGANRSFDGFALGILPRAPGAVRLHGLDLRIGEQHEGQIEFGDKLIVGIDTVSAYAYDYGIRFRHWLNSVAEPARFLGSARGIVFRIEPKHYVFPSIVAERMLLSVAPCQRKLGSLLPFKIRHGLPPVFCMTVSITAASGQSIRCLPHARRLYAWIFDPA